MRLAAAILIGTALFAAPAKAQDVGSLFGMLGIGGEEKDPIEYLERPPLVVPKNRDLPAPVEFDKKAAAWPKDPEDLARARRKIEERKELANRGNSRKFNDQLEFIRGEKAKKERKIANGQAASGGIECTLFGGCVEPDKAKQGVSPENFDPSLASGGSGRRYLTDPPDDLRVPAPEPAPGVN
jgi:hypothetical protein